jgi:DNA-binding winged helix-turn-helix (wHTH) protein
MDESVYRFGDFAISPAERRLFRGKESIPLSPQLFDALILLVRKPRALVPKSELMRILWPDVHVAEANLTNIIGQLRKLLGRKAIETVSKFGYRLTLPVTASRASPLRSTPDSFVVATSWPSAPSTPSAGLATCSSFALPKTRYSPPVGHGSGAHAVCSKSSIV